MSTPQGTYPWTAVWNVEYWLWFLICYVTVECVLTFVMLMVGSMFASARTWFTLSSGINSSVTSSRISFGTIFYIREENECSQFNNAAHVGTQGPFKSLNNMVSASEGCKTTFLFRLNYTAGCMLHIFCSFWCKMVLFCMICICQRSSPLGTSWVVHTVRLITGLHSESDMAHSINSTFISIVLAE